MRISNSGRRRSLGGRGFFAIVVSLSLGIAGATAAFSVVSRTPLVSQWFGADRLVWFMVEDPEIGMRTLPRAGVFDAWRSQLASCDRIEAFTVSEGAVRTELGARPVQVGAVTEGFFDLVATAPTVGRAFDASEFRSPSDVVIVGQGIARSLFGNVRSALGSSVTLDGRPRTIIGVVPADFAYRLSPGERFEVLRPLHAEAEEKVRVVGRLRKEAGLEALGLELEALNETHRREAGMAEMGRWVALPPGDTLGTHTVRMLEVVLLAGLVLLLVTGSNVAHLVAAAREAERREVAIRWALGAGRMSLLRWQGLRVLGVTLATGLLASVLAHAGLSIVRPRLPEDLRFLATAEVNLWSLAFALVASFVLLAMVNAVPLLSRRPGQLKHDLAGDRVGPSHASGRWRPVGQVHVVTVVAVSLALAVASILLVRTIREISRLDIGFEAEGLQVVDITLPETKYEGQVVRKTFFEELSRRLSRVGTVELAAMASPGPLELGIYLGEVRMESSEGAPAEVTGLGAASVGPGYFRTLGQTLIAGREFVETDLREAAEGIILSEGTASLFGFRAADALGKVIRFEDDSRRIVGVVADVAPPGTPQPFGSSYAYWPLRRYATTTTLLVRGEERVVPLVREVVADLDQDVVVEAAPMKTRLAQSLTGLRFLTTVFLLLATLSGGLALFGVYGVLSDLAARSRRQMALRMAIGASRRELRSWLLRKALLPCALGLGIGLLISYPLTRMLAHQLQGVDADDPMARVVASVVIVAVAVAATWGPTARTTRIEPSEILKSG